MKKILLLLVLVFSFLMAEKSVKMKKANDFILKDINNKNVKLSQAVKKYELTIINFWATWCMPCRAELKALNKLYKEYKGKNINIISISIDDPKTSGRVKSFVHANKIKHDVWLDINNEIMKKYHIFNPPFTMIVDNKLNLHYEHKGYRKGDVEIIKKIIDKHLTLEN